MTAEARFETAEILEGLRPWVEIESPSSDPQAVNRMMSRVQSEFAAAGAITDRIPGQPGFGDCLKVRSPWGGDAPGILVLGHLDTVHPIGMLERLPFRIEGDKAYGPGIYDMKSGAYIAFHAYRELRRLGRTTPLPITFFFNPDEEVSSVTSRPLIEAEARKNKYVLIAEPSTQLEKVVISRKGTARFNVAFRGVAAHSGANHRDGHSAVKEMARQILLLESMTDYDLDLTVNVGVVSGGTRANVVPEEARMLVDMRVPTKAIADEYIAKVRNLRAQDADVTITVEGGAMRPPFETTPETLALAERIRTLAGEIGFALDPGKGGGASDGNFTAPFVATVDGLGIVGEGAHTDHEHIDLTSVAPRAKLMYRLLETLN
jgi:glutamate carboxypeptidase